MFPKQDAMFKQKSSGSLSSTEACTSKPNIKTMLTYFLIIKGTIRTNLFIQSKTLKSCNTDISTLFNKTDQSFGQYYTELSHTALSVTTFFGKE
jgi:hypothetical protein